MVLITAMTIAAVAYIASNKETEPAFDMEGKTPVDLLDIEKELAVFEMPISAITFFNGDPVVVARHLRKRVEEIINANPWLGGWIHFSEGSVRLWYDKTGEDVAPELFRMFQADELKVSRESFLKNPPSAFFSQLFVKKSHELVGKNEPIWRLSLIPDCDKPKERFSLIMSMSHMGGDLHTFYQIHSMLSSDRGIMKLNPVRAADFPDEAKRLMGKKEAEYIFNAKDTPVQKMLPTEKALNHFFYVSEEWLTIQKILNSKSTQGKIARWLGRSKERLAERAATSCNCWGICSPRRDSALAHEARWGSSVLRLSTSDIVTSWFWNSVSPKIAFMPFNLRNHLPCVGELDAGNYNTPIPYTAADYKTPHLIKQSHINARRAGANSILHHTRLPVWTWDTSTSFSLNWLSLSRGMEVKLGDGCEQVLHMPLYHQEDLKAFPSNSSWINLFAAGPKKVGAHVYGPESVMNLVAASGIVKETITMY